MSKHERKFFMLWNSLDGPALIPEFKFHPLRKWKADFAHIPSMVLIEMEGGVWMKGGGGHTHGTWFEKDCEKYFEAAMIGFAVIRLNEKQINAPTIQRIIQFVRRRVSEPDKPAT